MDLHSDMDREIQHKRLKYRATHRGTKESDAIVGGFVMAHIHDMSDGQLDALEVLLDCPDTDLMDWLRDRQPMPVDQTRDILELLKAYQQRLLTD